MPGWVSPAGLPEEEQVRDYYQGKGLHRFTSTTITDMND
jgi:hypothetical protein